MTDIIIISLLVLVLCAEVIHDLLLLKIVAVKARAEPGRWGEDTLPQSAELTAPSGRESNMKIKKTFHEKWEEAKRINV